MKKKKPNRIMLNIRVTAAERKILKAVAKQFTDGNVSQWMRMAALNYGKYCR